jgi:Uri superfamily endonuclease
MSADNSVSAHVNRNRREALARTRETWLPTCAGTYVLIVEASARRCVQVGALGALTVMPGFYAYVGSARGPGGLAARLAHHRRRNRIRHWHIDYLRRHTALREIWLTRDPENHEHAWAVVLGRCPGATIPLARFGATDCGCRSHLFRFTRTPRLSTFRRRLVAAGAPLGLASDPEVVR